MTSLVKVGDSTYVVRGSPSTLIHVVSGEAVLVDPGHGRKRHKVIRQALKALNASVAAVVLTHYHSDHIEATDRVRGGAEVVASRADTPFVEDPYLRVAISFGYPLSPESSLVPFKSPPVRVDRVVEPPAKLSGLDVELVPLPGHTRGQVGVLTGDGVLYLADSAFGEGVISTYGIPYHYDVWSAMKTLDRVINDLAPSTYSLVLAHGPIASKEPLIATLRRNEEVLKSVVEGVREVLRRGALTAEGIASRLLRGMGIEPEPPTLMLASSTVKSVLAGLHSRGEVEVKKGDSILWCLT